MTMHFKTRHQSNVTYIKEKQTFQATHSKTIDILFKMKKTCIWTLCGYQTLVEHIQSSCDKLYCVNLRRNDLLNALKITLEQAV